MTFADWHSRANRLARGLVGIGVEPGARVAIHLSHENALRWIVTYTAVHRAGAVAVPLNPRLASSEIASMLAHAGVNVVVADGGLVAQDASLATGEGENGQLPAALTTVVDAGEPPSVQERDNHDSRGAKVLSWDEVLAEDPGSFQVPRDESDLADVLYTSGTTGRPKGVAVIHANAALVPSWFNPAWSAGGWLHASPLYTFAGLSLVYNPMLMGLRGIYQPRFNAREWLDVVARERPVFLFLVPAMATLLLEEPGFAEADLSFVQLCSVGSAPLAPEVLERLQERMPDAIVSNSYGMTEAGGAYCLMPKGEGVKRPGSVGRPLAPAEVRIVDSAGNLLPTGEVGEVRLRLPGRNREYFGDPEATARTWVDGWLVTGDLGRLDEDGYLYIVGRSKDVIIRGGNNIHAADVEHVIERHPGVREAGVVGVPHSVLGEDPVGFVVARPGATLDLDELRAFCLNELADYKVPRRWYVIDELPRNATGKIVKPELRRRLDEVGEDTGA